MLDRRSPVHIPGCVSLRLPERRSRRRRIPRHACYGKPFMIQSGSQHATILEGCAVSPFWPDGIRITGTAIGDKPASFHCQGQTHRVEHVSSHWRVSGEVGLVRCTLKTARMPSLAHLTPYRIALGNSLGPSDPVLLDPPKPNNGGNRLTQGITLGAPPASTKSRLHLLAYQTLHARARA